MKEDFLHYIWQFQKFDQSPLETVNGEFLEIYHPGTHNLDSGPDFFAAKLKVDTQVWAGNVEIHLRSSDWYLHQHEIDSAYDNVILHVVWEHDADIYRKDESILPTLELKNIVYPEIQHNYYRLFTSDKDWINCEQFFPNFNDFDVESWLTRLYFERLETKNSLITELLNQSNNDWEAVLFKLLAKNFGLNRNGDAFLNLANTIDFEVIRKLSKDQFQLEAVLLGHAGLLEDNFESDYFHRLKNEYLYLQKKFSLGNAIETSPVFSRLRPDNFPTIRLVQLASVLVETSSLFSAVIKAKTKQEIYTIFSIDVPEFWKTHYNFRSNHKPRNKKLSKNFIDLLIINTIVPLLYAFSKNRLTENEYYLDLIAEVSLEKNTTVQNFQTLKPRIFKNAMHSQSLLQLKKNYCDPNRCLKCALGAKFIKGKY
ncbi:DUF2851 family protein [Zunongwangia endophytica]|uniref:DUF2851 family protein n=1 Tax=Zunongwangia endophytica TaxID=1808945 RepID=A0ABV8H9T1_9FLAO|nr:DUF2851 family protein [Zunongwangia endophytica]MDN3595003.1 DUF2851 family protein [Zunongwangia endophytica]